MDTIVQMPKGDAEDLGKSPVPPKHIKTAEQKKEDAAAALESKILKALSSLPRGLPASLWTDDIEEQVKKIVETEHKSTPDGEDIIKIDKRWCYGDFRNRGLFMQEYKK